MGSFADEAQARVVLADNGGVGTGRPEPSCTASEYDAMTQRPTRELVLSDLEEAAPTADVEQERRGSHRYVRQLPGVMTLEGTEHPVTCLDVGYGGLQVKASRRVRPARGHLAGIRINLGPQVYADTCRVVGAESTWRGTRVHLAV